MAATEEIIQAYYAAFNAKDEEAFLALLTDDVEHGINQGALEIGKPAFASFLRRMNKAYDETIRDITILAEPSGRRAAAEFTVHGKYISTDPGLPEANGQTYILPAGAFFTIRDGKIARISNFYNLSDWLKQIS